MVATRAPSVTGTMSPKPTVENTVMVKYKASVRLRGSLNAWGWASASMT